MTSAALVAGNTVPGHGPRVVASHCVFYPDTEEVMGWDISEQGFRIVFSPDVPKAVRENLGREALLLADSLETGSLDLYEARHAGILALPWRIAELMLLLDRFPRLRRRALAVLAARPGLFRGLLAVHVGEQPLQQFLLRHGAELATLLLAPKLA